MKHIKKQVIDALEDEYGFYKINGEKVYGAEDDTIIEFVINFLNKKQQGMKKASKTFNNIVYRLAWADKRIDTLTEREKRSEEEHKRDAEKQLLSLLKKAYDEGYEQGKFGQYKDEAFDNMKEQLLSYKEHE